MAKLIILGSSFSIPDELHENTHLAVVGEKQTILIDCVSNPIVRLKKARISPEQVTDLILTHFHPDHVSGVPLLLMDMWLMGRKKELVVYGLEYTLSRITAMMELYGWGDWPGFFPVEFRVVSDKGIGILMDNEDFEIHSSLVNHMIPCMGLRIRSKKSEETFAYSSDTEPCDGMVKLAQGVKILIHEATGEMSGHASAKQAGEIASGAKVGELILIHYNGRANEEGDLCKQAGLTFGGRIHLAQDLEEISF